MQIAKLNNGSIVQVGHYRDVFPNVSFPLGGPDAQFMLDNECVEVSATRTHNAATEKLVAVTPYLEDDVVYLVEVQNLTQEELDDRAEMQWAIVRADRNARLALCDWTQLVDAPLDAQQKSDWADYRQELRDVPEQLDPFSITWPATPQ